MFGKQRLLAISLGAFAVGSGVCAVAGTLELMIVGRALQGLGGGVFPLCFGVVRDEFPKERVPTGIALLGAIAAIGSSIGLPLGGVLTDGPGYHWIFVVAAIMGALATATTLLFVPKSPIRTPGRVDIMGAAILGVALTALLLAISTRVSNAPPPHATRPKIGQQPPAFALLDQNRRRVTLPEAAGTKVVLVFYRGYW